jgi:hypothetical protein
MASFDYIPSLGGNAIFAAIFGVLIIGQLYFGVRHKIWGYMCAMILGLVLEVIGYAGRVMLNSSPFSNNDFLIYLITLTIAPALLSASVCFPTPSLYSQDWPCHQIYLCLSRIVIVYGESLSRFKPRTYTAVFCTFDFICLVLQGAGGGIAATANTTSQSNAGKNIMLAGLVFQVISLTLFAIACAEFAWRVSKNPEQWNQQHINIAASKLFKAFLFGNSSRT